METKNNSLAKKHRNIGNEHFRQGEYYDALLQYNHSLCLAETGSDSISIAYANRSAVYIKLNQFDLCLENIQRARDSNYPKEKVEKLNKREEECKELMKTKKPNPDDDPFNYFKLSYPPNPKNPQIVDCLELRKNKRSGIVTNRDLKTGDIIAIEEPVCGKLKNSARLYRCSFCMKDNLMNLIPCSGCAMAMFCSQNCQQTAMNSFHQFKCNNSKVQVVSIIESAFHQMVECLAAFDYNLKELKKFLNANKNKNFFDFDFSDPDDPMYKKNKVLLLSSISSTETNLRWAHPFICKMFANSAHQIPKLNKLWTTDQGFLCKFLQKLVYNRSALNINPVVNKTEKSAGSSAEGKKVLKYQATGSGSYVFCGLLNHSCDPNVILVHVSNKIVISVCKPIKKGNQIFSSIASFTHTGPKAKRQESLLLHLGRVCNCTACKNDWPTFQGLRAIDPFFQYDELKSSTSLDQDQAKKTIVRNNAYVDKNYKENDPTQEVYLTIISNFSELSRLTRPSFYT